MSENRNGSNKTQDTSLIVRSDWSVGPRTAAWDHLWRRILGGLDARPIDDGREQFGREVRDA
jgi:hypothetical protein